MSTQHAVSEEQAKTREVTIIVNGRPKVVTKGELSFDEIVLLAFPNRQPDPNYEYTVTYSKGEDPKKDGSLTEGMTVKVKEGLILNVTETNKS